MRALIIALMFMSFSVYAQKEEAPKQDDSPDKQIVEATCGQCNFGLHGTGCALAVKIDGEAYFVDGVKLFDLGDPHANDGMCNIVRKAEVSGEVKRGRFKATSFELLPQDDEDKE